MKKTTKAFYIVIYIALIALVASAVLQRIEYPPTNYVEKFDISIEQDGSMYAYISSNSNDDSTFTLTIDGEGRMPDYNITDNLPPWHNTQSNDENYLTKITKIRVIGDVENIGDNAFSGMMNVTDVTLCEKVKNIGSYAFRNCSKMKHITMPEKMSSYGLEIGAFISCKSLESITIPYGVIAVPERTFSNCQQLKILRLPKSVVVFSKDAFEETLLTTTEGVVYYQGNEKQWDNILIINDDFSNTKINYKSSF